MGGEDILVSYVDPSLAPLFNLPPVINANPLERLDPLGLPEYGGLGGRATRNSSICPVGGVGIGTSFTGEGTSLTNSRSVVGLIRPFRRDEGMRGVTFDRRNEWTGAEEDGVIGIEAVDMDVAAVGFKRGRSGFLRTVPVPSLS